MHSSLSTYPHSQHTHERMQLISPLNKKGPQNNCRNKYHND